MPNVVTSSGGIRPSRYAPVDCRSPGTFGNGVSVRAAPPTTSAASRTITDRPARASSVAATSALWPAPTTTTSARRVSRSGTRATLEEADPVADRARPPRELVAGLRPAELQERAEQRERELGVPPRRGVDAVGLQRRAVCADRRLLGLR